MCTRALYTWLILQPVYTQCTIGGNTLELMYTGGKFTSVHYVILYVQCVLTNTHQVYNIPLVYTRWLLRSPQCCTKLQIIFRHGAW